MIPSHHPPEDVLARYALGELRPAFATVAAAHLEICPACRADVAERARLAGEALLDTDPAPLNPFDVQRLLTRLPSPDPTASPTAKGPIASRIPFERKRRVGPSLWVRHAPRSFRADDQLFLLRAPGGLGISHGHEGLEFTVVLEGSLLEAGNTYAPGDFAKMSDTDDHRPVAGPNGCLCLIAAERPMRMHGWLGRLAQKLAGA